MRSYQVFAAMSPEHTQSVMKGLSDRSPEMFNQAVMAASAALKTRPKSLLRQPFERQASAVRRTLSRVAANSVAEEILAVYFLECRKELLVEWLDQLGVEHDEGTLKEDDPTAPDGDKLRDAFATFRSVDADPDRALLLEAFAAQSAIDWPDLEALLEREA